MSDKKQTEKHIRFPSANLDVKDSVPVPTLEKIADAHAYELWGEDIARGTPFPVADATGDVFAYVFPYIRGSHNFPEYHEIFDRVRRLRSLTQENSENTHLTGTFDATLEKLGAQFGSIYVSATRANFPILGASHFLHPYFQVGELAWEEARQHFHREDVELKKIYFLGPMEEYFEFTSQKDSVLIHVNSLEKETSEKVVRFKQLGTAKQEMQSELEQIWRRAIDFAPIAIDAAEVSETHTLKLISNWELIPVVNWTWWCVPTAWSMVVGFWDNYVKGKGTIAGYGRLIGFWFDHPKFPTNMSEPRNNVPSYINETIDPKTGTWREGFKSFEDFISKTYGYKFSTKEIKATKANDWAWNDLKAEADSGRPCAWAVPNHVTAAFGYRISSNGKFAILYNTWGTTAQQQRAEWNYTLCEKIDCVLPGGGTNGDHLVIISPDGEEKINTSDPSEITWFVWGKKIEKTTLSYSKDGGSTWIPIASNIQTKGAWNTFVWFPDQATTKGRIRIQGYTNANEYIAGDGSQTNFTIQTKQTSGYYNLWHLHSGKYVCTGYTHNGGDIHIWSPIPAGHEDRYKFKFISTGDGYYNLLHKHSGKYVCTGDKDNGAKIHIWGPIPAGHEDRYKFKLISTGDGYYNLLHKHSGKYVCTGDKQDGANIHIWGPIPTGHESRYKFKISSTP